MKGRPAHSGEEGTEEVLKRREPGRRRETGEIGERLRQAFREDGLRKRGTGKMERVEEGV